MAHELDAGRVRIRTGGGERRLDVVMPFEADGVTVSHRPDEAVLTFDLHAGGSAQRVREPEHRDPVVGDHQRIRFERGLLEAARELAERLRERVAAASHAAFECAGRIHELDLIGDPRQVASGDAGRPSVRDPDHYVERCPGPRRSLVARSGGAVVHSATVMRFVPARLPFRVVFIEINGRLTRVMDFGQGDRTLVTHGGWTGNWELWEQQAEALAKQGWRVIAYDHRGSGVTDTSDGAASISLDSMVDDLFAVMDALGIERCVVAGESMGTTIALLAVLRCPERFDGLVLVAGSGVWRRVSTMPFLAGLTIAYRLTLRVFAAIAIPERDVRRYVRRWALSILRQARPRAARKLVAVITGHDLRPRLAEVDVPTLVVHGTRDLIVLPRDGRALAAAIPRAQLVMIEGAGHVPTMTRPAEVSEAIVSRFTSGSAEPS